MNIKTGIATFVALALALGSLTAAAAPGDRDRDRTHRDQQVDRDRDIDRDRDMDRDRVDEPSRDRDRIQDQTHAPDFAKLKDDDIYGSEMMTRQERSEYRKSLQDADNVEVRERVRAEHQNEMQARAQTRNVELKPTSEGPIYGGAMLTAQERNQYREQLRQSSSDEQQGQFVAQHREKMQARAKSQGVAIEELEETEEAE